MMRIIGESDPGRLACVGGSWRYEPTVNYYRLRYRLNWLDEMKRTDEPQPGCRFLILSPDDQPFVERLGLRRVWSDPVSGAALATASDARGRLP